MACGESYLGKSMMSSMVIGVATSVSKLQAWDPLDTLDFAIKNEIPLVQLYLNETLLKDKLLQEKVRIVTKDSHITVTCHLPGFLNRRDLTPAIVEAACAVLVFEKKKQVVVHFDEATTFDEAIQCIKTLHGRGLSVGIENYHVNYSAINKNVSKYCHLISKAKEIGLNVCAVFDIPRLFIKEIASNHNSLNLANKILKSLAQIKYPLILHCIDVTDANQDREDWCAIGQGIIPYDKIFQLIKSTGNLLDHVVLEFEDKDKICESIGVIKKLCSS